MPDSVLSGNFLIDSKIVKNNLICLNLCSKEFRCKMVQINLNVCSIFMLKIKKEKLIPADNSIIFIKYD